MPLRMRFPGWLCLSILLSALLLPACSGGGPKKSLRWDSSRAGKGGEFQTSTFPTSDTTNTFDDLTVDLDIVSWYFDPIGSRGGRDERGFQIKIHAMHLGGETSTTTLNGYGVGIGIEGRTTFIELANGNPKIIGGIDVGVMDLVVTKKTSTGSLQNFGPFYQTGSPKLIGSYYAGLGLAEENFEIFFFFRYLQFYSGESYLTDLRPSFTGLAIGWRFK